MNLEVLKERWQELPLQMRENSEVRACKQVPFICEIIAENKYTNILEIGTFLGRTAVHLAAATAPFGGRVTTVNVSAPEITQAKKMAELLGIDNIDFVVGNSLRVVPTLEGDWDFVFIDGLHSHVHSMGDYRRVCDRLRPRATVVMDDARSTHYDSQGDGGVPKTVRMIDGMELVPGLNQAVKEFYPEGDNGSS